MRWHSKTFDRKADASRRLSEQLANLNRGEWVDPSGGRLAFGEFADKWLKAKTRVKRKTLDGYRSLLDSRILPTFGRSPLGRIDKAMVTEWVRGMVDDDLSTSRIRQAHQCLGAILEQAADDGLIGRNPARNVELPREVEPDHRFLSAEQVDRLADSTPDLQFRTMVYVLAYGGLRWGEMAALRRSRVDVLARRIQISESLSDIGGQLSFGTPKTHRRRTIQLPGFVASLLGQHLEGVPSEDQALVFTAPRGGPLRYSNMRRNVWNPARASAGADLAEITPHDLRHTCASLMRAAGADVKEIQQQLGHRSATVTLNTYTHLFEGDLAGVMDRLDDRLRDETRPERVLGELHLLQSN